MNSAGCCGAADKPRSDVLHRSSSAPVCFTGKPAAVLRLLGMAKPPLPTYLQVVGSTSIQAANATILQAERDTGDQPQSLDVMMVDAAAAWEKRTLSPNSRALRYPFSDQYDECRPHIFSFQTESLLPAVAAATTERFTGLWPEAAAVGCLSMPTAMAGVGSNTMGCDGGRLDGTIGDAVVAVGILTPGQHSPHQDYNRQQEQRRQLQQRQFYHQYPCKYLAEPLLQAPQGRPPLPFCRSASAPSIYPSPVLACTQPQGGVIAPLADPSRGSTARLMHDQLTACEAVLTPAHQAPSTIIAMPSSPSSSHTQRVLSALQPLPQQHHHNHGPPHHHYKQQQPLSTPQQPHRRPRRSCSSRTSSGSERESSDSEVDEREAVNTRRRSSNGTPITPPPTPRRRALSACSSFLTDPFAAAAADVPQPPAADEFTPALTDMLEGGHCCHCILPCPRCWASLGDTHLAEAQQTATGDDITIGVGFGLGMAPESVLTGAAAVTLSQHGLGNRARGQRSVGLTRKRLLV